MAVVDDAVAVGADAVAGEAVGKPAGHGRPVSSRVLGAERGLAGAAGFAWICADAHFFQIIEERTPNSFLFQLAKWNDVDEATLANIAVGCKSAHLAEFLVRNFVADEQNRDRYLALIF